MPPTSIGSIGLRLLAVAVLVAANACFVAAEFALVASRRTRLEALRRAGDPRAAVVLKALQTLTRYISGTQLGITLTSLALGWIGEPAIAASLESLLGGLPVALALSGVRRIARRHRRDRARQGDPAGTARRRRGRREERLARALVRAGQPRDRGRPGRHETPEGAPRDRARRIRRHGGTRHHGRLAGGDRRPDLRRIRSSGGVAGRGRGTGARRRHRDQGRQRRLRAAAAGRRLQYGRRTGVWYVGTAPETGGSGDGRSGEF